MKLVKKIGVAILLLLLLGLMAGGYWLYGNWYKTRAFWALFRNRPDETIVWCTKGLRASVNPEKKCDLYSMRAFADVMKQDVGSVTNDLNEAILLTTHFPAHAKDVAGLYTFRGFFRMSVECNEAPLADLDQAAALDPTDYQPFYLRAFIEMETLSDYVGAMRDLDKALSLAPLASGHDKHGIPKSVAGAADILDLRALARVSLEQYDMAAADYETSLRHTTKTDALKGKAILELVQRNYWAARLYCEDALTADNGDTNQVYEVLGGIAMCEGKNHEAREDFTQSKSKQFQAILDFSEGNIETSLATLAELVSTRRCLSGDVSETYGAFLFVAGRETEAHDYLERAVGAGGFPGIAAVLLAISDRDAGGMSPTKSQLRAQLNNLPAGIWPVRLVRLALGDCSFDEALKNLETRDPQIGRQHTGEANYVVGEMALKRGETGPADRYFQEAVSNCRPDTLAYILASRRLKHTVSKTDAS